jgi:hypothetical protein
MSKTLTSHVGQARERDFSLWSGISHFRFPWLKERIDGSVNLRAMEFDQAKVFISSGEGSVKWFDVSGEFYVVMNASVDADVLDESGEPFEIDSFYIPGLSKRNLLALKKEGRFVLFIERVEDFLDIYMVVMEFAADSRDPGGPISELVEDSHFSLFLHRSRE